jgi:epoxyqueuosine reductase
MLSIMEYRTSVIKKMVLEYGACAVGTTNISVLGLSLTKQYPFAICFTLRHDNKVVDQLPNDELWDKMAVSLTEKTRLIYEHVQELIDSWEYHYSRVPSTTRIDGLPEPGEEIPQKTLATLSGLGWIGKSSLLITPSEGPRVRIGTLLTDLPLVVDIPVTQSNCKQCKACVEICPVGAINGEIWSQGTPRKALIDIQRCYDHLWSVKNTLGRRQLCGLYLKVCPIDQN